MLPRWCNQRGGLLVATIPVDDCFKTRFPYGGQRFDELPIALVRLLDGRDCVWLRLVQCRRAGGLIYYRSLYNRSVFHGKCLVELMRNILNDKLMLLLKTVRDLRNII